MVGKPYYNRIKIVIYSTMRTCIKKAADNYLLKPLFIMFNNQKSVPQSIFICLLTPLLLFISCQDNETPVTPGENNNDEEYEVLIERVNSDVESFRVVRVAGNLEHPWGMAWLPGGQMLITERAGRMLLMDDDEVISLAGLPEIRANNQGGLLDVELHPDYENNGWIYFTYSAPANGGTGTALARARLGEEELTDLENLYTQEPAYSPGRHYGSRISFLDDGTLLFTIGDRGQRSPSQDNNDPTGTTIRLNDDGSIPADNPFINDDSVLSEIYTYGHRNAQGMAIHPETGAVWQHEHGPRGGDELNIIRPGGNYGWPEATYGGEYSDGSPIGVEPHEDPDVTDPVIHWSPTSIAPSGMDFYTGDQFPNWSGDIFLGALAEQHLRRVVIEGEQVVNQEVLLENDLGRVRDVKTGPDGYLYILTDHSNGGLYRLEPVE